jgi:hypothetical protein
MRFRRNIIAVLSASFAALFYHCANLAGGGGSEWEAKITGYVVYNGSNIPATGTRVVLCPERFLKDTAVSPDSSGTNALRETVTDGGGFFSFNRLKPGIFHIEASNNQSWASFAICEVSANDTGREIACTLKPTGRISGTLGFPEGYQGTAYIQVYGLDRVARVAPGGKFTLSDIPEGAYTLRVLPSHTEYLSKDVGPVPVTTGVETDLGILTVSLNSSAWSYKRLIYLNTSASGANVAGNVVAFPVLVRLNSGNFDFTQAKADGGDLRFTKADGSPLPCELARWDGANDFAEVWVKVDTVLGNNAAQYFIMLWGNPTAISESSGPAVFDSSSGFEGVWHLNETSGTLARDASHNGFMGTYKGGLPRGEPSPLGISQNIRRPDSDYVDMGNMLNPGMENFSLGLWLKRAALSTQQALIAKTNGNAPSTAYGYLLNFDDNNIPHLYMASGGTSWGGDSAFDVKANLAISDSTTWHYACAVIDRSNNALCKMYVDGADRTGVKAGNVTSVSALVNALNLHVGTESDDNCSYSGSIGEVTVAFTARSADWVKLCYMNQKEQDALVKW